MQISDRATRLTARVAPYQDAIAEARQAGLTWGDIAALFGVKARRLQWAVKHCPYRAVQIPLPDLLAPAPAPTQGKASAQKAARTQDAPNHSSFGSARPRNPMFDDDK